MSKEKKGAPTRLISKWNVLYLWEKYSGITLAAKQKEQFYDKCTPLQHFDYQILKAAMEEARKDRNFKLAHLEEVGTKLSRSRPELQPSSVNKGAKAKGKKRTKNYGITRKKRRRSKAPASDADWWFVPDGPRWPSDLELHKRIGPTQRYDDDL